MPNLRVISDNVIDRATLSGSSAANFSTTSLQTQRKSDVWRSAAGTAATLRAVWNSPEPIQAVALPFCNLSPTATMRVRVTSEGSTTNYATGSETLSDAAGWSGCSISSPGSLFNGAVPYVSVAKLTTNPNENRSLPATVTAAGSAYTLTLALRAGTSSVIEAGLYDATAASWGLDTDATFEILSGPGIPAQIAGALINVSGLSTSTDTLLRITRTFQSACTAAIFLYPDSHVSSTIGQSNLVTRVQLEPGSAPTSYYPAGTVAATRPLGYIDSWQSYTYDSGAVLACPAPAVSLRGFTAAQAANAYAFGGGATARHWITAALPAAYGLAVDISDPGNLQGYIEASFLVAGAYWEPSTNFDYGASAQLVDLTKSARNDAGDLLSDIGTISRKVGIPMSKLSAADRSTLWSILRASGTRYPIFISMFPENADLALERDHQVYGKLIQLPAMSLPFFNLASATVEVESI